MREVFVVAECVLERMSEQLAGERASAVQRLAKWVDER